MPMVFETAEKVRRARAGGAARAEARDAVPVAPVRRGRRASRGDDRPLCAPRRRIERLIGRLERSRRIATRHDETATSPPGFVDLASIRMSVGALVGTAWRSGTTDRIRAGRTHTQVRPTEPPDLVEADQRGERGEGPVDVGAPCVADREAPEAQEPGQNGFDHPAVGLPRARPPKHGR